MRTEAKNSMNNNEEVDPAALKLWNLLDDIDTLSDAIHPNSLAGYKRFFELAMNYAERRHTVLHSDGYKLYPPDAAPVAGKMHPGVTESELWPLVNRYRGELTDKKIAGTLSDEEMVRFDQLQRYADRYLEMIAARPTQILEELEKIAFPESEDRDLVAAFDELWGCDSEAYDGAPLEQLLDEIRGSGNYEDACGAAPSLTGLSPEEAIRRAR